MKSILHEAMISCNHDTGPWEQPQGLSIGKDYLAGSPVRQKHLEIAVKWISSNRIEKHMPGARSAPAFRPVHPRVRSADPLPE